MTIYSAYLPPDHRSEVSGESFKLIPDASAPFALMFGPFWLGWHRLWLELLAYIVFTIGILLLVAWQTNPLIAYLSLLPGLYLFLEGREHIRQKLERRGWQFAGVVEARNLDEAELRFVLGKDTDIKHVDKDLSPIENKQIPPLKPVHSSAGLFPE